MGFSAATRRAILARQGGRCARGAECASAMNGAGVDLEALRRHTALHRYLPPGHAPVVFDHVQPRCDAVLQNGQPCVFHHDAETGAGAWVSVDDPRNSQALCGWCNHAKTEGERAEYPAAAPSVFAERGIKPRAAWRPASKTMRLRCGAPAKNYAI